MGFAINRDNFEPPLKKLDDELPAHFVPWQLCSIPQSCK